MMIKSSAGFSCSIQRSSRSSKRSRFQCCAALGTGPQCIEPSLQPWCLIRPGRPETVIAFGCPGGYFRDSFAAERDLIFLTNARDISEVLPHPVQFNPNAVALRPGAVSEEPWVLSVSEVL